MPAWPLRPGWFRRDGTARLHEPVACRLGRALARDSVELLLPVASVHNADGAHAVDGMRLRVLDGSGEACVPQAGGCDCGRACDDPRAMGRRAVRVSCRSTIRNSG